MSNDNTKSQAVQTEEFSPSQTLVRHEDDPIDQNHNPDTGSRRSTDFAGFKKDIQPSSSIVEAEQYKCDQQKQEQPQGGDCNAVGVNQEQANPYTAIPEAKSEFEYKFYRYRDRNSIPKRKMLLKGMFGPRDIGIFFGAPGSGKTFVILNFCVNASLGNTIADEFEVERPLGIVYCAGEGSDSIFDRIETVADHIETEDLPKIIVMPKVPQLFGGYDKKTYLTDSVERFILECKAQQDFPIDLLVIDTLHSATVGADENSSQHMGIVLNNIKHITNKLGCAVISIHHTTKTGKEFRGSSALEGDVDFMVKIAKATDIGNAGVMSCEKLKDGKKWKQKSFVLTESGSSAYAKIFSGDSLLKNQTINDSLLKILATEKREFTSTELASMLEKDHAQISNNLAELTKAGKCRRRQNEEGASGRKPYLYSI